MARIPTPRIEPGFTTGRLTVVKRLPDQKYQKGKYICKRRVWLCSCQCGATISVREDSLASTTRPTQSCGCLQREHAVKLGNAYGGKAKHGDSKKRIHNIWYLMCCRCFDSSSPAYVNYGGRGISVCEEWSNGPNGYLSFKSWATQNGYSDSLTIDRIDNDGNYCPENCRWIPLSEQARNKRSNRLIEYNGEVKPLSSWASTVGIPMKVLHRRIVQLHWPIERAFTEPVRGH